MEKKKPYWLLLTSDQSHKYLTFSTNLPSLLFKAIKGVVDWFFSRLDCVYGVQSSMCSCLFFLKTHYFSHNLPLFHTSLSLLWQTPRFISWFYEAPPSMGWDWLAGSVCCDWLNRLYCTSERPAPLLSGMRSGWIVNSGVVYNAYQFEPDWNPEDISEEDRTCASTALNGMFGCCCLILLNTLLFVSATASVSF